jgi:low temperature requirement protein LtrA
LVNLLANIVFGLNPEFFIFQVAIDRQSIVNEINFCRHNDFRYIAFMKNFRIWWQVPRKYSIQEEERRVTFLELFYDLVYVVIIAELAHSLSTHINIEGFLQYAFLFLMVWWAWSNGATYHDLHGNNDIRTRVMTFLQMMTAGTMAVFAHDALGEGSVGFAISYTIYLLIMSYLWWRTGVHEKEHRPLSTPFLTGYLLAALLTLGSVFIEPPMRFYIWGFNLFIILLLPAFVMIASQKNLAMKVQFDRSTTVSKSMMERFGLLTIIVLGEVIVGVVQGVAGQAHFSIMTGITGGLGMLIAIGIWWLYFDLVSSYPPRKGYLTEALWIYLHLPLYIFIAAAGAAVLNLVNASGVSMPVNAKILLSASISISLLSIYFIHKTIQIPDQQQKIHKIPERAIFTSAFLVLIPCFFEINSILFLSLSILIILTPVFFGVRLWVKSQITT